MASSSGCTQQVDEMKESDRGSGVGESTVLQEYVTAHATESEHGSRSCESFLTAECASVVGGLEKSLGESGMKEEIERSKQHWSLLADPLESGEVGEGVVAEVDNMEVFKALQMHPTWGGFFGTFGHDVGGRFGSEGELVPGEKFAGGGQAELYHAQVTWKDAKSDRGSGVCESTVVQDYLTAHATESEHGSRSCESFLTAECASVVGGLEKSLEESGMKEEIERSKRHWSLLADPLESGEVGEGAVAEVDNLEVFKALQMHLTWGRFFCTFGHDVGGRYGSMGELVVGEKFAEGGQAEIYHAHVTWKDARLKEDHLKNGREWVVKVFKEGTFLRQLLQQLPHGYLKFLVEEWRNWDSATPKVFPRHYCGVYRGILLESGRFAFLMVKEHFDLRNLIEWNMKLKSSEDCGPFSHDDAQWLMYSVAVGVKWLHEHDVVHRDLKASNVLVKEYKSGWPKWVCYIADFECSVGVVGTGFFRAPEILQACKDQKLSTRQEVFTKAADVYSYGMTCYEILTGKLPFEGHPSHKFDMVLSGTQPVVPEYVDEWTCFLLSRCWQLNPLVRPSMEEIVNSFLNHSFKIREYEQDDSEYWRGQNQQSV